MDTEINSENIIGHIVGLSEINKDKFLNLIKKSVLDGKVNILDLDKITNKIIIDKQMGLLYEKYNELNNDLTNINKKLIKIKKINKKIKELEKKMNLYWKSKMEYHLTKQIKLLSHKNKYILLVGYISYYKNHRIYLNLNINMKFFLNVDHSSHTKDIINYNIDNFKDDILNGTFDLNFLSPSFLIKKRNNIMNIYNKIGYINMNIETIINTIELNTQINIPDILYIVTDQKYDKKIPINNISNINNFLIAYDEEWLALTSPHITNINNLNPDESFNIIKGLKKKKPFIKINNNIIKTLQNKYYLYEIDNTNNFIAYPSKKEIYKYITSKFIKINRVLEINNLYNQIQELEINIIK